MFRLNRLLLALVALRKESVDRNQGVHYDNYNLHWSLSARRAWIEISGGVCARRWAPSSLSARRAWIEITVSTTIITICIVALRKESVDRNCICIIQLIESGLSLSARRAWIEMFLKRSKTMKNRSLSARRAWIEILLQRQGRRLGAVALRKESVDRNVSIQAS